MLIGIAFTVSSFAQNPQKEMFYMLGDNCSAFGVDTLPTAFYSFRLLSDCYNGKCVNIRRSSDNATSDIGFLNGFADTSALKTFLSSSDGFVVTFYDQSLHGWNVTQAGTTAQPKIATAGVLIYAGGHLAIQFDGSNDILSGTISYNSTNYAMFGVTKRSGGTNFTAGPSLGLSTSTSYIGEFNLAATFQADAEYNTTPIAQARVGTPNTNLNLCTGLFVGTSILTSDGTSTASATITGSLFNGLDKIALGGVQRASPVFQAGYFCEGILYLNDMTAKRTTIESNIKTFYGL